MELRSALTTGVRNRITEPIAEFEMCDVTDFITLYNRKLTHI
jgi:hypothetical protein